MPDVLIKSVTHETDTIRSFTLVPYEKEQSLPAFEAGAHIDVHLPSGLVRQYSLLNAPSETNVYRIAVWNDPDSRGGSVEVHQVLQPGMSLRISAPRNRFPLIPSAGKTVLLAGGIGITPLLAMAHELHRQQAPFALHYCGREASRMAFVDDLKTAGFSGSVDLHVSQEGGRMDAGRVLANPDDQDQLYVCGSPSFIDQMLDTACSQGWKDRQLHREYFTTDRPTEATDHLEFEFELVVGGKRYPVPADKSAADVLAENGFPVSVSCGQGLCGACLTRVVDGTPDHRDLYLTEEEQAANDQFTPCCSRSRSARLVIEL